MSLADTITNPETLLRERRHEVPDQFSSQARISIKTAELTPTEILDTFAKAGKFPLFRIRVSEREYLPSKPILIHIYQDGDWFFAENETLVLVGTGQSKEEAVLDLEQHIVHFWNYYKKLMDDKISGDAVRLKKVYSGLFVEKQREG